MDQHTTFQIKGEIIWTLGPKAKNEFMGGQWGRELKDVGLQALLKLFKKTSILARNVFHSRAQFFNIKQDTTRLWKNIGNA